MLKIAFASADRITVDQHFGAAAGFVVYAVSAGQSQLVAVLEFPPEGMDGNENKLAAKISALEGCAAMYCLAAGGSAVRQLLAAGIQPLRLEAPGSIEDLLASVRDGISRGGIPWIDKALRARQGVERFERMAEEGWQE